jgi:hypothetical protein
LARTGGRKILKGIWLSFLPGAKIGVLGTECAVPQPRSWFPGGDFGQV